MNVKIGKFETQFSGWLAVLLLLVADNMYTNHCNTKMSREAKKTSKDQSEEMEES